MVAHFGQFWYLLIPVITGIVWLVRLEGKIRLNAVRLDHKKEKLDMLVDFKDSINKTLKADFEEVKDRIAKVDLKITGIAAQMKLEIDNHRRRTDS